MPQQAGEIYPADHQLYPSMLFGFERLDLEGSLFASRDKAHSESISPKVRWYQGLDFISLILQ